MTTESYRVYVAGPVTGSGHQHQNAHNAIAVAHFLAQAGLVPFVPHLFWLWDFMFPMPHEFWMRMCREWLQTCDFVVRLPGASPGADEEVRIAKSLGIPVYQNDGDIGDHFVGARLLVRALNKNPEKDWQRGPRALRSRPATSEAPHQYPVDYNAFSGFQRSVSVWLDGQPFGVQEKYEALLGMTEELGELAHAHLKNVQGIRGFDDENKTRDAKADAIGDIFVYAAGYCRSNGLDLGECVARAWEEVRERDWNKNQANGKVQAAPQTQTQMQMPLVMPGDAFERVAHNPDGTLIGWGPTCGHGMCRRPAAHSGHHMTLDEIAAKVLAKEAPQRMVGADRVAPHYSDKSPANVSHFPVIVQEDDGDVD